MNLLETILLAAHVLVAIGICGFVLLQHGKGADMGAAFGSGSSGSLFGAAGSANFLSRTTSVLVGVFFVTSLGLTWYASTRATHPAAQQGVMDRLPSKANDIPAAPAGSAAPATPPAPAANGTKAPASPEGSKAGDVPK
ncbi:MAG: preprotein translocase subunit SecG [Pseudomonadota bacterium]|nr:preprotein translocase subunit SecG [Pseudomonadota bacterium]